MSGLSQLPAALAVVPLLMGVAVIAYGVLRAPLRRTGAATLGAGLALGLEFLLAAGLLRLASLDDFAALGIVAAVIVLRSLIGTGVRIGLRALGQSGTRRLRAWPWLRWPARLPKPPTGPRRRAGSA